jgi:GTP-binding protein
VVSYPVFHQRDQGQQHQPLQKRIQKDIQAGHQNGKAEDIELNVCKTKHLTNTRSSSADEALRLTPPRVLSLEQALDFIDTDELLEVTPENLRIRKKILDSRMRKRSTINK